jgi:hypothetical protein
LKQLRGIEKARVRRLDRRVFDVGGPKRPINALSTWWPPARTVGISACTGGRDRSFSDATTK